MACEDAGQNGDRNAHTEEPADAEPQKKQNGRFSFFAVLADDPPERADEVVVNSGHECDRAAGNAGDAVRQRHEKAADGFFDKQSRGFLHFFILLFPVFRVIVDVAERS